MNSLGLARTGGCLLGAFLWGASASVFAAEVAFPDHPQVVDVTRAPYHARGDGVTDDTAALQRALNENVGRHRLLYFPSGTYLISATLTWPKRYADRDNWGFTYLCGASRETSVIRLQDGSFPNGAEPQALMWCGGFGSADWFHNYIENLTFDVGEGNPGAIGLQFYTNNSGAVRNCRFAAPAGSGHTGLDLAHRDMNGPLLVRHCDVEGFRRGVATGHAVNSQVFEHLTLRGQTECGLVNEGQTISIRGLTSKNSVPAISSYGLLCLVEAELVGEGDAARMPAIVNYNGGQIFLRDVRTSGYQRTLADVSHTPDSGAAYRVREEDKVGDEGPHIVEYCSEVATSAFPSPATSLRLPTIETPETPQDPLSAWANVDDFSADPTGEADSAAAVQRAIDSGATTVFLPGHYRLGQTVVIRGRVRRITGLGGQINYGRDEGPDFRFVDGAAPIVFLEHFGHIGGGLEVDTGRTLVVRSVSDCDFTSTAKAEGADWFFEDVVTHDLRLRRQRLWARQLNIENEGTHLANDGGSLWALGFKTERGGTLVQTQRGGRTEVLGGFSYTTTAGGLAPMFVNADAAVWTFFREICFNDDPFQVLVRETRGTETREIVRGQGGVWPYAGTPER